MAKTRLTCIVCVLLIAGCGSPKEESSTEVPVMMGMPQGPGVQDAKPTPDRPDPINLTAKDAIGRGTTVPTIIDTRTFEKQINRDGPWLGPQRSTSSIRPRKHGKPATDMGPANGLVAGQMTDEKRVVPGSFFPGISTSPWTPPDPALAAGPNHIIETVNMELAFFSKGGTLQFQQTLDSSGSPGFFEDIGGGNFCFDPKCFYDHYAQRWIVLALEVYSSSGESWITFAISDDDDPHGVWYKYRTWSVVNVSGTTYWVDYPGLGYDQDGYYVTGNLFKLSGGGPGFGGVLFRAFDKAPLLNGNPATFNDIRDGNAGSAQVAQHFGNNQAPYFVSRQNSSSLRISAMEDPHGSPTLNVTTVGVPSGGTPPGAPNLNGGTLSTVDARIMNVHWRNGRLWACNTVSVSGRAIARWYEMNTNDWPNSGNVTLTQSGDINPGAGQYTFFPAIYTDNNDNAAIVVAKSSSSEYASVQAAGRLDGDPAGTMGALQELVVGSAGASGRWGDYFDIALDPTDGTTFWMVGEYNNSSGWQTWIDSFSLGETVGMDAVNVVLGNHQSGDLTDLDESDDSYLCYENGAAFSPTSPSIWLDFETTLSNDNPSAMTVTIESQVDTPNIEQKVELFNYNNGNWITVDTRLTSINNDSSADIQINGNVSRFVEPGTGVVKPRITYTQLGAGIAASWEVCLDHLVISVN